MIEGKAAGFAAPPSIIDQSCRNRAARYFQSIGVEHTMADVGGVTAERLLSFIERVERLEEEKSEVQEQIKEVLSEARGEGFDVKIMRQLLRLRKMKPHDRVEQEELLETYKTAIGMA
jgi:uncharacterized protein (UPF0335 family)